MAAHDLRNPLHSIKMMLAILNDGNSGLQSEYSVYVREIETAATNMLDLIENLLDTEIIESGRLRLNIEPFHAADIVKYVITRYEAQAMAKKIEFHTEFDSTL